MIKKLISLMTVVCIILTCFTATVLADGPSDPYPRVIAELNFDDLPTDTVIDKTTNPDKYFFKDDNGGPGNTTDNITPAVQIVEAGGRKYAKVTTYTNANEAFGVSPAYTQAFLTENGYTKYPDKVKVEFDLMKDGHSQAIYGYVGYSNPISGATQNWGEFMMYGSDNTFTFARQMSSPVKGSAVAAGNWAHVEIYMDFKAGTFDCYLGGTYLGTANLKSAMTTPEYLSFACYTNKKTSSNLCIDNIKISAPPAELSVIEASPADGASIFDEIKITTNNPVGVFDYTTDMQILCDGAPVAFEASASGNVITAQVKEGVDFGDGTYGMNFGAEYTVVLNNSFTDAYKQTLAEPYEFSFTAMDKEAACSVPKLSDTKATASVYNPSETDSITAALVVSVKNTDGTSTVYTAPKTIEAGKKEDLKVDGFDLSALEDGQSAIAYVATDAVTLKPMTNIYVTDEGVATFVGDKSATATVNAVLVGNKATIDGNISAEEAQDIILTVSKDGAPITAVLLTTEADGTFNYSYTVDSMELGRYDVAVTGYSITGCTSSSYVYLTEGDKIEINGAITDAAGDAEAVELAMTTYKEKIGIDDKYFCDNTYNVLSQQAPFDKYDDMVKMISTAYNLLDEINAADWSSYFDIFAEEVEGMPGVEKSDIMLVDMKYLDDYNGYEESERNIINQSIIDLAPFASFYDFATELDKAIVDYEDSLDVPSGGGGRKDNSYNVGGGVSIAPVVPVVPPALFTDMSSASWATAHVQQLYTKGIVSAASQYRPLDSISREEFVKMLVALCGIQPAGTADFADVNGSEWFAPYLAAAKNAGIINGDEYGNFGVGKNITRQDMVVMASRAVTAMNKTLKTVNAPEQFTDGNKISDYAAQAVTDMQQAGVVSGMGDGSFAPAGTANRAQAAVVICNLINAMN